MSKLPRTSGFNTIKNLCRFGWRPVRQKGSHVILIRDTPQGRLSITVPLHKELDKGLLRKIIKESGIDKEEFLKYLLVI